MSMAIAHMPLGCLLAACGMADGPTDERPDIAGLPVASGDERTAEARAANDFTAELTVGSLMPATTYLGPAQKQAFKQALTRSRAKLKTTPAPCSAISDRAWLPAS